MNEADLFALHGLEVSEAHRRVEARGLLFRIVSVDGEFFSITADLRRDRVNVDVRSGKIELAEIG
jgi:hypothetical protein